MVGRGTTRAVVGSVAVTALASAGVLTLPAQADGRRDRDRDRSLSVERFADRVDSDDVLDHLDELQDIAEDHGNTRASGTPGYDASVDYVVEELRDAGYEPVVQTFEFPYYEENGVSVSQVAPVPTEYATGTDYDLFEFSGSGEVEADVVPVDLALDPPRASTSGCQPSDFLDPEGASLVDGRIALVQRGGCAFGDKVSNAGAAGAVAVVVMNQGDEDPTGDDRLGVFSGTLGGPAPVPAISVAFSTGQAFAATTGLVLRITAETLSETRTTSNVVAETRRGDTGTVVMAGAHLDSVVEGPGINDNGSGSAALLEIAIQLAEQRRATHTHAVRFAWWGAEESNLLGSTHYVQTLPDEAREQIGLYLNVDMIASPNYVFGVYDGDNSGAVPSEAIPAGSAEIEQVFRRYFAALDEPAIDSPFSGRSDYGPFIAVGIPAGGLFTGAENLKTEEEAATFGGVAGAPLDPCYHEVCDDLEGEALPEEDEDLYEELADQYDLEGNVNEHALEVNTHVIAATILSLARDASAVTGPAAAP